MSSALSRTRPSSRRASVLSRAVSEMNGIGLTAATSASTRPRSSRIRSRVFAAALSASRSRRPSPSSGWEPSVPVMSATVRRASSIESSSIEAARTRCSAAWTGRPSSGTEPTRSKDQLALFTRSTALSMEFSTREKASSENGVPPTRNPGPTFRTSAAERRSAAVYSAMR